MNNHTLGGVLFTASLAESRSGLGKAATAGEEPQMARPQRAQHPVPGEGKLLAGECLTARCEEAGECLTA